MPDGMDPRTPEERQDDRAVWRHLALMNHWTPKRIASLFPPGTTGIEMTKRILTREQWEDRELRESVMRTMALEGVYREV